jgi:hypothetical protein
VHNVEPDIRSVRIAIGVRRASDLGWHGPMPVIEHPTRRAAVFCDQFAARFSAHATRSFELPAAARSGVPRRAVLELRLHTSGHPQRALIGGSFVPSETSHLVVRVNDSGPVVADEQASCPSRLGPPLFAGLPDEFAGAVADTLGENEALGPGLITIDRSAYDDVESTENVFSRAVHLLTFALAHGFEADTLPALRDRMLR